MDKRTCSAHIFWSSALSVTQRGQQAEEACHRRILRNITLLILQNHVRIKKKCQVGLKRSQQTNKSKQNNRSGQTCREVSAEHSQLPKMICVFFKRGPDPFIYHLMNQILLPQVVMSLNVL